MVSLHLPTARQHQIEPYHIFLPSWTISADLRQGYQGGLSENLHFGAPPLPNRPAGRCLGPRTSNPGRYPIDDNNVTLTPMHPQCNTTAVYRNRPAHSTLQCRSSLAVTMTVRTSHANQRPALFRQVPTPGRLQTTPWSISWETSHSGAHMAGVLR